MGASWKRTAAAAALTAAAAFVATGPARAAGPGAPEKTEISFGIIPTMDYIPVKLAIDRGYFKAEGLNVTMRVTPPGNTVPALIGGALDVSGVNWISTFVAFNRNIPIKVIAEADAGRPGYVVILVRNDSPIRDLHGLVGKKLGSPSAPPGTCDVMIADALQKTDAGTGIGFTSLPVPQMMPTLAKGDIDAVCLPEPLLAPVLQRKEARVIYDPYSGDHDGLPIVSYVVSAAFAEKNPNTVAAVKRAIAKGEKLCLEDEAAVRAALPSFVHITAEEAAHVTLPRYVAEPRPAQIERLAKLLGDLQVLDKPVKVPTVGSR